MKYPRRFAPVASLEVHRQILNGLCDEVRFALARGLDPPVGTHIAIAEAASDLSAALQGEASDLAFDVLHEQAAGLADAICRLVLCLDGHFED